MQKLGCTALAVLMLGACSQQNSGDTPGDDNTATAFSASDDGEERAVRPPTDPFPSTYRPYPSDVVLIAGATILTGAGEQIDDGSILMQDGKIMAVGAAGDVETPDGARVIDAEGKWVTPGIIEVHAHLGNDAAPANPSTRDVGEWGSPNTAQSWVEHGVWPQDAAFARALAGGLTSMQVLPGSGNLFSGRSVILKNVPERTVQGMKFPDAPYGIKMACGENPRSMFGPKGGPSTRMGNMSGYREAWIEAERYKKSWEDYWQAFEEWTGKDEDKPEAPDRDLKMETLAGVLSGDFNVSMHCYRADEMVFVIDMAKEFGYQVNAFHHATEAYKVADYLLKTAFARRCGQIGGALKWRPMMACWKTLLWCMRNQTVVPLFKPTAKPAYSVSIRKRQKQWMRASGLASIFSRKMRSPGLRQMLQNPLAFLIKRALWRPAKWPMSSSGAATPFRSTPKRSRFLLTAL